MTLNGNTRIGNKLNGLIKSLKIVVEGPIWYDILLLANKKINLLQEQ